MSFEDEDLNLALPLADAREGLGDVDRDCWVERALMCVATEDSALR